MRNSSKDRVAEADQPLLYQHDARPHTAKIKQCTCVCGAGESKRVRHSGCCSVYAKSQLNPNVDDLAFFHSLKTDVSLVEKETRKELLQAVETYWYEYPAAKMRSVCLCPYGFFHGILESSERQRQQFPTQPWRSSSSQFKRRTTWRSPRSNRVSATCKRCRPKAGSARGVNQRGCRLDVIKE